jgi:hypothetical protein
MAEAEKSEVSPEPTPVLPVAGFENSVDPGIVSWITKGADRSNLETRILGENPYE